jgi:ABC-type transporter Mla subunit MlaD
MRPTLEDIFHRIGSYFAIQQQGHKDLMTTIAASMKDFNDKVAALEKTMEAVAAKQAEIQSSLTSAVDNIGKTVGAGHSTFLGQMVDTLTRFDNGLVSLGTALDTMHTTLKSGLAAIPTTPSQVAPPPLPPTPAPKTPS